MLPAIYGVAALFDYHVANKGWRTVGGFKSVLSGLSSSSGCELTHVLPLSQVSVDGQMYIDARRDETARRMQIAKVLNPPARVNLPLLTGFWQDSYPGGSSLRFCIHIVGGETLWKAHLHRPYGIWS
jgi:hypothetical protein